MLTVSYYLQKPTRCKLLAKVQNCRENISKMDEHLKGSNQQLRDPFLAKGGFTCRTAKHLLMNGHGQGCEMEPLEGQRSGFYGT